MVVLIFWGRRVVDLEAFSPEKKRFKKALIIAVKCISRGKKEKKGKKQKKRKKHKIVKRGGKKTKKRKKRGNAFYRNLVGAAFDSCILSKEKASKPTTLLLKKFKTNMPLIYRPSSFKNLRV